MARSLKTRLTGSQRLGLPEKRAPPFIRSLQPSVPPAGRGRTWHPQRCPHTGAGRAWGRARARSEAPSSRSRTQQTCVPPARRRGRGGRLGWTPRGPGPRGLVPQAQFSPECRAGGSTRMPQPVPGRWAGGSVDRPWPGQEGQVRGWELLPEHVHRLPVGVALSLSLGPSACLGAGASRARRWCPLPVRAPWGRPQEGPHLPAAGEARPLPGAPGPPAAGDDGDQPRRG